MSNVLDDLTTRFKSFSDTLEQGLSTISDLPSMLSSRPKGSVLSGRQLHGGSGPDAPPPTKSRKEREARAELILQQLPQAYFDQGFDPLEHELRQMGDETKQEDVDSVVERLSAAVEVVGVRLAKQVQKQQEKLIAGITNVTHVEDDLKAAHVICKGTRSQLRMAAEDVQRQIKIITTTRKKQAYMEVLEVANKMKKVQDLQQALRKVHEAGAFGDAILLCMDCFQAVDTLGAFKVEPELRLTVQQQYYDTQQRLGTALLNVCSDFTLQGYSKLLEAYLLQGLPGPALAAKVLACFRDSISDAAMRLVRSMVLAKAAFSSPRESSAGGASSSISGSPSTRSSCSGLGDCTTEELCKLLSPDMVQPCLSKLLEVVFELLCSYRRMAQWHRAGIEQQQAAAAAAAAALKSHCEATSSSGGASSESAADPGSTGNPAAAVPSQAELDQVQAATSSMLEAVAGGLASSRMDIIEVAGARVCELLAVAKSCQGEDFIKVLEGCLQFVSVAEAFTGCSLPLRATVLSSLAACVDSYQKANMEALRMSLALEDWQPLNAPSSTASSSNPSNTCSSSNIDISSLKQHLSSSPYLLPAHGQSGCVADFDAWVQAGNPFTIKARTRAVGGQSVVSAACGQPVQPPEQASGTAPAAAGRVATKSSLLVLRRMNNLAAMMPVLPASQPVLWAAVTELFDNFLLACFILFSDVNLEALVWQDDLLPHRLRSALLRITTSSGCKYKAQVEELQRTKPAAPQAAPSSSSILDFGFITSSSNSSSHPSSNSSRASKFDAFTKKFKDTMVELINTDLSQPLPNNSMHSPNSHYPMYQQQPMIASPNQQQPQAGQQLQQPSPASKQGQPSPQQQSLQRQSLQPGGVNASPAGGEQRSASPAAGSSTTVQASSYSMTHEGMQYQVQGAATREFGLKERVLAIESLTAIADSLKAAKPALLAQLGPAGMSKEVEGYFSRTVDAALDLRDAIDRGGARQLLAAVVDPDKGTAAQIAGCNYNVKEPATRYQPWAEALVKQYRAFNDFMLGSSLPQDVQQKMWEAAVRLGCDAILDGLGRVSRCSLEGRAGMSLDLSAVEKGLRPMAPATALASLRLADNYIKAFYIPWEELGRWAQIHLAEYGKHRVLVLVEAMSEAYGIKRQQKAALIDKLNAELAEFG